MNRLTAAFVRTVKPTDRLRRYGDGNGLYLLVKPGPRPSEGPCRRHSAASASMCRPFSPFARRPR